MRSLPDLPWPDCRSAASGFPRLKIERIEVRVSSALGGKNDPAAIGREHRIVIRSRIVRQPPRLRLRPGKVVHIPIRRFQRLPYEALSPAGILRRKWTDIRSWARASADRHTDGHPCQNASEFCPTGRSHWIFSHFKSNSACCSHGSAPKRALQFCGESLAAFYFKAWVSVRLLEPADS